MEQLAAGRGEEVSSALSLRVWHVYWQKFSAMLSFLLCYVLYACCLLGVCLQFGWKYFLYSVHNLSLGRLKSCSAVELQTIE